MTFKIGKEYHGFIFYDRQKIELNDVDIFYFEHIKSGAKLVYLAVPDKKKSFSISFRTYSMDDTGIAHVLEHSVLRGSRKYKTRHPFMDFVKHANNSNYNACTGADFTRFYVTSSERKEFFKMIDMLMDGVFYPQVRENESIFLQDAWRYEFDEELGEFKYNGVVYNEMKPSEGNIRLLAVKELDKIMFPETHYAHISGGKCDSIIRLTHSDVASFHEKYYKADNSLICISGKLDIEEYLDFLNREYLSKFERTGNTYNEPVEVLLPGCRRCTKMSYPVLNEKDCNDTVIHILSFYMPKELSDERMWALNTVFSYLSDEGKCILKDALAAIGISVDVYFGNNLNYKYPNYKLYVYGTGSEEILEIEKQVYKAFSSILMNGIDNDFIDCQRNSILFDDRMTVSNDDYSDFCVPDFCNINWLFGRESVSELNKSEKYEWLRSDISKDFYGNIVRRYLLDNPNVAIISVIPEYIGSGVDRNKMCDDISPVPMMGLEEMEDYAKKLKNYHEWLSGALDEELNYYEVADELAGEEVTDVVKRNVEVLDDDGLVYVKQSTDGIVYAEWWFDISGIESELIPYIRLHDIVMWNCGSGNFSAIQKSLERQKYFGELEYNVEQDSNGKIYFKLKLKTLKENFGNALDSLKRIFSDVHNILPSELQKQIESIIDANIYAINYESLDIHCKRVQYNLRPVDNCLESFNTFNLLATVNKNCEDTIYDIFTKLTRVNNIIFKNSGYKFGYSCDEEERDYVRCKAEEFNANLGVKITEVAGKVDMRRMCNEGIIISGEQHALAFGVDLSDCPHISMLVMETLVNILDYDYLYEKIRVQGGAYSWGIESEVDYLLLYSNRDPDIGRTYDVFKAAPEWLESIDITQEDIMQHTESIVEGIDLLNRSKESILTGAIFRTVNNIKQDALDKVAQYITDVKVEDVKAVIPLLKEAFKNGIVCAVSDEEEIRRSARLFDKIIDLRMSK